MFETNLPTRALSPPAQSLDESWIISILEKLDQARHYDGSSPWATQSICRVPEFLRDFDETAYTPQIISIGPYHYHNPRFHKMNIHKWRALHRVLERTRENVHLYLDAVSSLENSVRACYEPLSISTYDLVESLVLDSIFVLELFQGVKVGFQVLGYAPNDSIFTVHGGTILLLQQDMIMLENQLPLFLLDRIFALQLGHKSYLLRGVAPLALFFFKNLRLTKDPCSSTLPSYSRSMTYFDIDDALYSLECNMDEALSCLDSDNDKALHCLDLLHRKFLLACPKLTSQHSIGRQHPHAKKQRIQLIHCASQLQDVGIKLRCRLTDQFWNIEFKDVVLKIPPIFIVSDNKSLFLNLIAFEQCDLQCRNHITSYIAFMGSLINSEADVKCLHDQGIIQHLLENDREVVNFFNQLCRKLVVDVDDSYLSEQIQQLNSYYDKKWDTWRSSYYKKKLNTWKVSLKHKYFSNPWTFISLIAAIILLLLAFAQTFYAIYDHYKPN